MSDHTAFTARSSRLDATLRSLSSGGGREFRTPCCQCRGDPRPDRRRKRGRMDTGPTRIRPHAATRSARRRQGNTTTVSRRSPLAPLSACGTHRQACPNRTIDLSVCVRTRTGRHDRTCVDSRPRAPAGSQPCRLLLTPPPFLPRSYLTIFRIPALSTRHREPPVATQANHPPRFGPPALNFSVPMSSTDIAREDHGIFHSAVQ